MESTTTIEENKWYKPMDIAKAGWITTPGTNEVLSAYHYILRLIRNGKLKAVNYAEGEKGKKYFKVLGRDILEFINNEVR